MTLRALVRIGVLAGSILACSPAPRLPDIVVLSLGTTRADHLGLYGYPRPVSPSLDAFAREAVVYERAWTTAPSTLPAHASMFTGRHPTSHGAHFDPKHGPLQLDGLAPQGDVPARAHPLAASAVTLAELAAENGYATGAFVGGPWLSPESGVLQGFDHVVFDGTDPAAMPASVLTRAAIGWLDSLAEDRAALLFVHYFDPHAPYDPPERFRSVALGGSLPPSPETPLAREQRETGERYDGEIRFMDHYVGGLLATLRRHGRYEDAIVVVVSDHGELFGEHQAQEHRRGLYEGALRVPLLVRYRQGRDGGTRNVAPVSIVDLLPLVARESGLRLPPDVEGRPIGTRELVLAESHRDGVAGLDRAGVAAIRWPWKLIQSSTGARELFRLDEDPAEAQDRAASEDVSSLETALTSALASLRSPHTASKPPDAE